jgi:hypothetical protein
MRLELPVPVRKRRDPRRLRIAVALLVAPLVIGSPLILAGLRDPASIGAHWDQWLIFVALPWAGAAWMWFRRA